MSATEIVTQLQPPKHENFALTTFPTHQHDATVQQAIKTPVESSSVVTRSIKSPFAAFIIVQLTIVTFMSSFSTGMITVAIPNMAEDLSIPVQTYYWPLSVYGLTAGAVLLPAGAVADVVGSRLVYLTGVFFLSVFIVACGIAQSGIQLVMFRAMQGIAVSLTLPASVGILTNNIPAGRLRNISFACTGLGMPLGFSVGSVLGGVFVVTVGWRVGWYLCAGVIFALFLLGTWSLPPDHLAIPSSLHREYSPSFE